MHDDMPGICLLKCVSVLLNELIDMNLRIKNREMYDYFVLIKHTFILVYQLHYVV